MLLIDDGSTDRSFEVCKEYERLDKRIHVMHQKNAGVSIARNTGIENAHGKYIAFVDSDDIVSCMYIQTLVNDLRNSVMAMCAYEKIYSYEYAFVNIAGEKRVESAKTCAKRLLQGDFPVAVWRALFVKKAIGDIRFMDGIRNNEDKEFLYHYLLNNENESVVISNKKLYGYYVREGSAARTKWNCSYDMAIAADRMQQLTMDRHPEWEQDAINNSIRARMSLLKWIIQEEDYSYERKIAMNKLREDILHLGYPYSAGFRTRVEYVALKFGMWVYRVLFFYFAHFIQKKPGKERTRELCSRELVNTKTIIYSNHIWKEKLLFE